MNKESLQFQYALRSESSSDERFFSELLIPLGPPTDPRQAQTKQNLLFISGLNEADEVYQTHVSDARKVVSPEGLPLAVGLGFRLDHTFQKTSEGFSIHYATRDGWDLGELAFDGRSVQLKQNLIDHEYVELFLWVSGTEIPRLISVAPTLSSAWAGYFQSRLSRLGNICFHPPIEDDVAFAGFPAIHFASALIPLQIESLDGLVNFLRDLAFDPGRSIQMPTVWLRLYYQAVNYVLPGRTEGVSEEEVCRTAAVRELSSGVIPIEWPKLETGLDGSKAVTCRRLLPVMAFTACLRDIDVVIEKLVSRGFVSRDRCACLDVLHDPPDSSTQTVDHSWSTLPFAAQIGMAPIAFSPMVRIQSGEDKVIFTYFCTPFPLDEAKLAPAFRTPEDYGRARAMTRIWKAQCLRYREEATRLFLEQIKPSIKKGECHEIR